MPRHARRRARARRPPGDGRPTRSRIRRWRVRVTPVRSPVARSPSTRTAHTSAASVRPSAPLMPRPCRGRPRTAWSTRAATPPTRLRWNGSTAIARPNPIAARAPATPRACHSATAARGARRVHPPWRGGAPAGPYRSTVKVPSQTTAVTGRPSRPRPAPRPGPGEHLGLRWRHRLGEADEGRTPVCAHVQRIVHECGDVGLPARDARVPVDGPRPFVADEPLALETAEDRQHRRVGVAWQLVRDLPARQLVAEGSPQDVHDPPFEITQAHHGPSSRPSCP